MATFWDPATRDEVCRRVERLTLDHKPEWGKMNVAQMLAHLNDALRMAAGDLATTPKNTPLRRWPIKQLIVYVLPWPKGAPTAPELLARVDRADFAVEQTAFRTIVEQLAAKSATDRWPEHPAFGPLTYKAWGVLGYRHADHHLRQFGV
jgi:DinB superfamily